MRARVTAALMVSLTGLTATCWPDPRVFAQPSTPAAGLIMGRVVDADAGTPLSGVIVMALGGDPVPGARAAVVVTDPQGRFVFRSLPQASYTLTATVGGNGYSPNGFIVTGMGHQIGAYLAGGYGQRRPNGPLGAIALGAGERIGDAEIRLWKGGAINGRVFDEAGEPLVDLVVSAVRRSSDGRLLTGPTTKTDDRGAYRLGTLTPGEYVIVVPQTQLLMPLAAIETVLANPPDPAASMRYANAGAPPPPAGGLRVGSSVMFGPEQIRVTNALLPPPQSDIRHIYQTTFHPSVHTAPRATAIVVRSGEERTEINVQLQPVRAVSVSGTLMDAAGPVANFGVHLMPADTGDGASVLEVATVVTDGAGTFVLPLVPPGNYTLIARRSTAGPGAPASTPRSPSEMPGAWANVPLSVGDAAVRDVVLSLRPGVPVSGRLEFQGSSDAPIDRLKGFSIAISPSPPLFRNTEVTTSGPVTPSGEFAIRGAAPGRYVVTVRELPPPWSLQSITAGGRDITDTAFVLGDDDVKDLVVTFTDRPAVLEGRVTGATAAAVANATVYLFPSERARWTESRSSTRAFRAVRVQPSGVFKIPAMIPGDYLVAAASDAAGGDWPDQRALARLAAGATAIEIQPNQPHSVSLRLVSER